MASPGDTPAVPLEQGDEEAQEGLVEGAHEQAEDPDHPHRAVARHGGDGEPAWPRRCGGGIGLRRRVGDLDTRAGERRGGEHGAVQGEQHGGDGERGPPRKPGERHGGHQGGAGQVADRAEQVGPGEARAEVVAGHLVEEADEEERGDGRGRCPGGRSQGAGAARASVVGDALHRRAAYRRPRSKMLYGSSGVGVRSL